MQGDVSEEIEEFLLEKYPVIPEDNIELVEDKKKKAGAGAPAGFWGAGGRNVELGHWGAVGAGRRICHGEG